MPRLLVALLSLLIALPTSAIDGWHEDVDAARRDAIATGKPILVDLFAEWCGWCHRLEESVFTDPFFQRYTERFVRLRVDVEDRAEGSALRDRFGVDSLPTTLILDAELAKIGEVRGFHPAPLFVNKLSDALEHHQQVLDGYRQVLVSDDAKLVEKSALYFRALYDSRRTAALYERLARLAPSADVYYRLAEAHELGERWPEARTALSEARRRALGDGSSTNLAERLDLLDARIARGEGNCRQAISTLHAFLDRHPKSPLGETARRLLGELEHGGAAQCV